MIYSKQPIKLKNTAKKGSKVWEFSNGTARLEGSPTETARASSPSPKGTETRRVKCKGCYSRRQAVGCSVGRAGLERNIFGCTRPIEPRGLGDGKTGH